MTELCSPPSSVVKKAVEYKTAMRLLQDSFQVATVVGELIIKVIAKEYKRLAELREDKSKIVEKIMFLRDELDNHINDSCLQSLPQIHWKTNVILEAGEKSRNNKKKQGEKRNKWKERNNPRWYDFTINELLDMLDTLVDICKTNNSLEGLLFKLGKFAAGGDEETEVEQSIDLSKWLEMMGDDGGDY